MAAPAAARPNTTDWVALKEDEYPSAVEDAKKVIRHEPTGYLAVQSFIGEWTVRDPNDLERKVAVMKEFDSDLKPGAWAKGIVSMLTEPQTAYRLVTNDQADGKNVALVVPAGGMVDLYININDYDYVPVQVEHLLRITQNHFWVRATPPPELVAAGEEAVPTVFRILGARPVC